MAFLIYVVKRFAPYGKGYTIVKNGFKQLSFPPQFDYMSEN